MAIVEKKGGKLPVYKGDWSATYNDGHGYMVKNRVTIFGSELESLIDNNTHVPATRDEQTGVVTFEEHWKVISNGSQAYAAALAATKKMAELEEEWDDQDQRMTQMQATINAKQLEVGAVQTDEVPTENSGNHMTSGDIYQTLKNSTKGFVDDEPTAGSDNLVKSGGVQVALMDRAIVGDIVGDPAQAWEPGTVEAYVDQKIAEQNALLNAKMSRQDAVIHTLNGQDVVLVSALPQTGEANKIYRLTGTDSYTDYMWDASLATPAFTAIATYSFPGIDDVPIPDSENIVKSGAVADDMINLESELSTVIPLPVDYTLSFKNNNTAQFELTKNIGNNSITVLQKTRYDSGAPTADLKIKESGSYILSYEVVSGSFLAFVLYEDNAYKGTFYNNSSYEFDKTKSYFLKLYLTGSFNEPISLTIKDIRLEKVDNKLYDFKNSVYFPRRNNDITVRTNFENAVIKMANGELDSYPSATTTDYIPVEGGKTFYLTASMYHSYALYYFYDENKAAIIGSGEAGGSESTIKKIINKEVVAPTNASYIRISYLSTTELGTIFDSLLVLKSESFMPWIGKKWAAIGDSLTEHNNATDLNYHDYVSEVTGITVVNLGHGGTGYARGTDTFLNRVSQIPSDADVITIFGSGNDLGSELPVGEITDDDNTSVCGCINLTIDAVIENFPLVPFGIITPTPWQNSEPSDNGGNSTMARYSANLVEICKRRGVPCLDLYHCSNLHPDSATFRQLAYSKDNGGGVHPDENGHKIIAPRFEAFLKTLLLT